MKIYQHTAYNLATGEILQSPTGNSLKRAIKLTNRRNQLFAPGERFRNTWRFCHDGGKSWTANGLPQR